MPGWRSSGAVRTDLDTFAEGEQLVLMNHGWALADAALRSYVAQELPAPVPAGTPPDAHLLTDQDAAAEALEGQRHRPHPRSLRRPPLVPGRRVGHPVAVLLL